MEQQIRALVLLSARTYVLTTLPLPSPSHVALMMGPLAHTQPLVTLSHRPLVCLYLSVLPSPKLSRLSSRSPTGRARVTEGPRVSPMHDLNQKADRGVEEVVGGRNALFIYLYVDTSSILLDCRGWCRGRYRFYPWISNDANFSRAYSIRR